MASNDQSEAENNPDMMEKGKRLENLRNVVSDLYERYLYSYPGSDDYPDNMGVYKMMQFDIRDDPSNEELLEKARVELEQRMGLLETSQNYVDELNIGLPDGKTIFELNFERFREDSEGRQRSKARMAWAYLFDGEIDGKLFPRFIGCARMPNFSKPSEYLYIALVETTVEESEWKKRLDDQIDRVCRRRETAAQPQVGSTTTNLD